MYIYIPKRLTTMKRIIFFFLLAALFPATLDARKVKGTVHCADAALSGVIVTDGRNFTTTDERGNFKFRIDDDARFVYVVTPSGYTADFSSGAPQFYAPAQGRKKFDFDLIRTYDTDDYTIFSVSDPQFKTPEQFDLFCGDPLEDLVEQAAWYGAYANTVGIALGDICWDNLDLLEPYKKAIVRTGIPFYAVIGNHDHDKDAEGDLACAAAFESSFGPANYAFCLGPDVVICLDNIIYEGQKKYVEGYADHVLAFVEGLLAYLPAGTHLYIAQHSPLYHWTNRKDIVGAGRLLKMLEPYRVDFLSGHTHYQNNLTYTDDIVEHNAPSICGAWWDTLFCRDGAPRGYEIFTHWGGELQWVMHPIDFDDDFQVEVLPIGASRFHPDVVVANVWDYDPAWTVEWYQDGVAMGPMREVQDCSPSYIDEVERVYEGKKIPASRQPKANLHYFAADPDADAAEVTVVVTSRFGKQWRYSVDVRAQAKP